MMNKSQKIGILSLIIGFVIIALLIVSPKKNTEEYIPLPPDVVQLSDGSFVSLSPHYDKGFFDGLNVTITYLHERGYLKDSTVNIELEYFLDSMNAKGKIYFDEYKERNEHFKNK